LPETGFSDGLDEHSALLSMKSIILLLQ